MAKTTGKTVTRKPTTTVTPRSLPNVLVLTKSAATILWQYRMLFAGITAIYGLLNVIFAQALSGGADVNGIKQSLDETLGGNLGHLGASVSVFVYILGTAGNNSSQVASAYQLFLTIISSLAVIWALRQVYSGAIPRVRDAFYRGMFPLVPFILVLLVIALQMIPLLIGSALYSLVISNGIAVHIIEKLLWGLMYVGLASVTIYWLTSSVMALYVVTLPEMTPTKALRSAKDLVKGKRWIVLRKLLFLPLLLFVAAALIMILVIIIYAPLAKYVYFVLTMFGLVAIHSYIYALYRELLNE